MPQLSTPPVTEVHTAVPSGVDSLWVRERYLRRRGRRRRLSSRGLTAAWVVVGALVSWLFIVGFSALGH